MAMKHQIQAVLFDLDGVVVFTDRYHYLSWQKLSDEEGWAFDEELNHRLRGIPRMASLQVILDHNGLELSDAEKAALADRKNRYYRELLTGMSDADLYPGVMDLCRKLKAEGTKLAVCSSSKNAHEVLDSLGIAGTFDAVVAGNDITCAKPDPEIFLAAAERLSVPPFHCMVFEDAEAGVQAARAAGMKAIGVGTPDVLPGAPECVTDYGQIDVGALLDAGRATRPPAEPWTLAETRLEPKRLGYWETVLALCNGYMGLRGTFEEEDDVLDPHAYPGMYVNGVYDYEPYRHVVSFPGYPPRRHAVVNLCDWRIVNLAVDGEPFSMFRGELSEYRRELDMRRGLLTRSLVWTSPAGRRVRIRVARLVSMARRHNAAIRYEATPLDSRAAVTFAARLKAHVPSRVLPGRRTEVAASAMDGDVRHVVLKTSTGPFSVALALAHVVQSRRPSRSEPGELSAEGVAVDTFHIEADVGETVALERHACVYSTVECEEDAIAARAVEGARSAARDGFGSLAAEQAEWWRRFWEVGDVRIDGNVEDQQAVRFSLFHLRQSNPEDDHRSVGANGMTGDAYSGHVFWDTEMYVSPYYLYTQPETVRPLLMYRYGILDRARERARQMDGVGALYSWNSISGEECGVVYEAATAEYHLVSDIAYALKRYVDATGDVDFLHRYGAEMLFETTRFLADRGRFIPARGGRFCINVVCGPDEYGCGVNNNCYTNMLAQWHFRCACEVYDRMEVERPTLLAQLADRIGISRDERQFWQRAADRMYVPFNEALGIHEQDDSFLYLDPVDMSRIPRNTDIRDTTHPLNLWRMQVAKQADVVLLMFVLGDRFDLETKRRNYEFYEPRTCHGSSLSACSHSIVASEIGEMQDAYNYFRQSARMDLDDFKGNTSGGLHAACLGGTWMAVVNGFAGMRDYDRGLEFAPTVPPVWDGYGFTLLYRGARIQVDVKPAAATYRLLTGGPVPFTSGGTPVDLTAQTPEACCEIPAR
jgi:beta-phosphoglucomutase